MSGAGEVVVTQADVKAARAAQVDMLIGGAQGDAAVWRKVEQAEGLARHRQSAEAAQLDAMREAPRQLGQIVRRCKQLPDDTNADNKRDKAHAYAIAQTALASLTAAIEGKGDD